MKREVKVKVTKFCVGREELINVNKLTKFDLCIINGLWETKLNATAKRKLLTPDGQTDSFRQFIDRTCFAIRSKRLKCCTRWNKIQRAYPDYTQSTMQRWHDCDSSWFWAVGSVYCTRCCSQEGFHSQLPHRNHPRGKPSDNEHSEEGDLKKGKTCNFSENPNSVISWFIQYCWSFETYITGFDMGSIFLCLWNIWSILIAKTPQVLSLFLHVLRCIVLKFISY